MIPVFIIPLLTLSLGAEKQKVGERPYEMVWAGREEDDHPPLIDFERLDDWTVRAIDAEATLERSREQQIFGKYVAKLTYCGTGMRPEIWISPPEPIEVAEPFDAVSCWVYGNNWGYSPDPTTPQVEVTALFEDANGEEFDVSLTTVRWKEWFLCHRRLAPDQIEKATEGTRFKAFIVRNGRNEDDRVIYFDNLAVFREEFPLLTFEPRPQWGVATLPGQRTGTNTGPGKLPFPTRQETILPDNLTDDFVVSLEREGGRFVFNYEGADGKLEYRIEPRTGTLGDIAARWAGRGGEIRPCVDGGIYLHVGGGAVAPEGAEHLGTSRVGDTVESRWLLSAKGVTVEATFTYRLWGKSLVIDVVARGGSVSEVRYGHATGIEDPRLVTVPYYLYGSTRPAIVVFGPPDGPLFLAGHTDWYLSNASSLWADNVLDAGMVKYNGGMRYLPKTDGTRNDCYERIFITLSPRFEEMLPNIPNPKSPWMEITGTHVWRAHGAGNRESDVRFWTECRRYGMTEVVVTDHESGWRDGGESFTFRTRAAPGKGGDKGQYDYARVMQDELGFVYGPYNNFTDFSPVNEYWAVDRVNRMPDGQLQQAWPRCYAPKPSRAVEFCELLTPQIQRKFRFSTAYCDVHTCIPPWSRTDYDHRVPGAGTFAAVFYAYGEIMLLQKQAWNGPVYSEGNHHYMYCGLADGNYGQDQRYRPATSPWLVDFDLRKMHDLCCNFGMGNLGMFYDRHYSLGRDREQIDASIDRFLAATVAFGHTGFLVFEGGLYHALRSYYMLQQLHSSYALSSAEEIHYVDENGRLLDTSAAVATGVYKRSQIVTRYANGCVTAVNGHPTERMNVHAYGRVLDLPPNGYAGWTEDGEIEVLSTEVEGHRYDYAVTPAYLYIDGRGAFTRLDKAASNGIGVCRILPDGTYEIIPYEGAECGFDIPCGTANARDKEGNVLGPAELRRARGLTYAVPIDGAFSYVIEAAPGPPESRLRCDRDEVIPGELVIVEGDKVHELVIPTDAAAGDRIWRRFEEEWIDFTVVEFADVKASVAGDKLRIELESNSVEAQEITVRVNQDEQRLQLPPKESASLEFEFPSPGREAGEILAVEVRAGEVTRTLEYGLYTKMENAPVVDLPGIWRAGLRLRGEEERFDLGETAANAYEDRPCCGGVAKEGLSLHPPWVGGVGYVFVLYEPVTLPDRPEAAFRALVGKRDGSYLGDGILYKVAIVDAQDRETVIGETVVKKHGWRSIEGDLSPWAGQRIRIKLVSDVGTADDSNGDWACWADMRIESLHPARMRVFSEDVEPLRWEPGPFQIEGLSLEDLRSAKRGWLRYDGMGLSGRGDDYESFAVLNGVHLGNMEPAAGNEVAEVWTESVGVALSEEAIRRLDWDNRFSLENPRQDWFKVRRFWIQLELADGRKCSSRVTTATYTQPPGWRYAEGIGVPFGENIEVDITFGR